jgi:tRNA-dihydrouridine synthase B
MAGTGSVTFRTICHEFGSAFGTTELVSARGIAYQRSVERSFRYLEIDPEREGPCAIQLFGHDEDDFRTAIPIILRHPDLSKATFIDLNMGCPVAKVVKTGAGAALMRDIPRAAAIITAATAAAAPFNVPVTVKFRSGWDENHINAVEFARMCRDSGVSAITVHARTCDQMYHGKADWNILAEVSQALRGSGVAVIGNGDVKDGETAERMLIETGVDGVAVGRAAQGNPWVFEQIRAYLNGEILSADPTPEEKASMILRHLRGLMEHLGEERACKEMRSQLACYFKGMRNASDHKAAALLAVTYEETAEIVLRWAEQTTSEIPRGFL